MKHLYKFLLALIMVAASSVGNKANAQNSGSFEYSTKCLTVSLWATNKQAYDSCAQVKFALNGTYVSGVQASYTFTTAGTYQVCMKIYNPCKKWDTVICKSVTVAACDCDWSKAGWGYANKCRDYVFEGINLNSSGSNCVKYSWYINNSFAGHGRILNHSFSQTGSYSVCLKLVDSCHKCDTVICKTVKVECNPCNLRPEFSWKNDCLKAKFIAGGKDSGATYSWSFGDGHYGTGKEIAHTYQKTGYYKVCLKMTWKDPNTGQVCSETVCKEIKIGCGTDCNIKGDFTFSQNGGMVKFQAYSNNGVYYHWNFGDGTTGTGKDPVHYYKKPGTYQVCVTIYDKTKKCSVKICKQVVVKEQCNIRAAFAWKISGSTVYFSGVAYNGDKYFWDFGDGTTGTGRTPHHTYSKAGTYKVCMTVYSYSGKCKTTICKTITVGGGTRKCDWAKLAPDFYYNLNCPKMVLEGKNLNNTGTNCYRYGFSVTPAGTNQSKTYYGRVQTLYFSGSGTYNICMKVYDSCNNCDTIICKTVSVKCDSSTRCDWSKVQVSAYANCRTIYAGVSTGSGCVKAMWYLGNTTGVPGNQAKWTVNYDGVYKICVKLYDSCHKCDTTICREITVKCDTKCDWSKAGFSYTLNCNKLTVEANSLSSGSNCIRYIIAPGDGKYYYSRTASHTYTQNGTYNLCIKVIDTCNQCDTVICKSIKVDCNYSKCNWSGGGFAYKVDCNKVYLEANNMKDSCVIYAFYTGNSMIGIGRTANVTFSQKGTYTICMKMYDTCNKCDTVICQSVKVDCLPCKATAKFTVDSTNSSGVAYITNYSTGGYYYVWDFGDSTFSYSKNPGKHAYASSGYYNVCLTVYDSLKTCSTKYCVTIKIVKSRAASVSEANELPVISVFPNPADARFTINTGMAKGTYEVLNLQGRLMTTGTVNGSAQVSTEGWAEGVYLIKTTLTEGQVTTRLIVTRQ